MKGTCSSHSGMRAIVGRERTRTSPVQLSPNSSIPQQSVLLLPMLQMSWSKPALSLPDLNFHKQIVFLLIVHELTPAFYHVEKNIDFSPVFPDCGKDRLCLFLMT